MLSKKLKEEEQKKDNWDILKRDHKSLKMKVVVMKTEKGICTVQSTEWSDWIELMGEREMSRMTLIFYLGQLGGRWCHEY